MKEIFKVSISIFGLMLFFLFFLINEKPLQTEDTLPVKTELPEQILTNRGFVPFFCQNQECLNEMPEGFSQTNLCAKCGSSLSDVTLPERLILPSDTIIKRKRYSGKDGSFTVSIVISGKEQKSIHRPQQCLPAQGFKIIGRKTVFIKISEKSVLKATRLRVEKNLNGIKREYYYCYWFTDGRKTTPYHLERLIKMSLDRIIRKKASRWAYISVSTEVQSKNDNADLRIANFVSELYPLLANTESDG